MKIKGVLISEDYQRGKTTLVRMCCKMWSCPYCGPRNAIFWRAYLLNRFNKPDLCHEKWIFMTITAHRKAHISPEMTVLNLQQVWKKLYDRLLRRYGKEHMQYVRVFEQHKTGRFHMHILLNAGDNYDAHQYLIKDELDEFRHPECRWLRLAVSELGGGWRCHIRRVWDAAHRVENVGIVVGYILKYMGKQMSLFAFPKNQRRILTSRKIGSPAKNSVGKGTWKVLRELPLEYVLRSQRVIEDITEKTTITASSFEGEHYYPPLRYYRG